MHEELLDEIKPMLKQLFLPCFGGLILGLIFAGSGAISYKEVLYYCGVAFVITIGACEVIGSGIEIIILLIQATAITDIVIASLTNLYPQYSQYLSIEGSIIVLLILISYDVWVLSKVGKKIEEYTSEYS